MILRLLATFEFNLLVRLLITRIRGIKDKHSYGSKYAVFGCLAVRIYPNVWAITIKTVNFSSLLENQFFKMAFPNNRIKAVSKDMAKNAR